MTMNAFYDAAPLAALGLSVGIAVGAVHFATLWRITQAYLTGEHPGRTAALHLARLIAMTGTLGGLAWLGAPALLAGLAGVMLARRMVLRRAPVLAKVRP